MDDVVRINFTMNTKNTIEKAGAKFDGIQEIKGKEKYALATDLITSSTYYLPIKGLTKAVVQNKLIVERRKRG